MAKQNIREISPLEATVTYRELLARLPDWVRGIDKMGDTIVAHAVDAKFVAAEAESLYHELARLRREIADFGRHYGRLEI